MPPAPRRAAPDGDVSSSLEAPEPRREAPSLAGERAGERTGDLAAGLAGETAVPPDGEALGGGRPVKWKPSAPCAAASGLGCVPPASEPVGVASSVGATPSLRCIAATCSI